jgi:hypothetical protein
MPDNLYITATVHAPASDGRFDQSVLRHAGLIEIEAPPVSHAETAVRAPTLPPIGYQRLMADSAVHSLDAARHKLAVLLGHEQMGLLHPSLDLAQLLWRCGITLGSRALQNLTHYLANSFDAQGHGLFDSKAALRNAQMAYDAHVIHPQTASRFRLANLPSRWLLHVQKRSEAAKLYYLDKAQTSKEGSLSFTGNVRRVFTYYSRHPQICANP